LPASSAAGISSTFRFVANSTPDVWSSPAFLKRTRIRLDSLFESSYDPFAEEEGYITDRIRKRTKLGRFSGQWRYVEKPLSPENWTAAGAIGSRISEVVDLQAGLDAVSRAEVGVDDIHSDPVGAVAEMSAAEVSTTTSIETREVAPFLHIGEADTEKEAPFTSAREPSVEEGDMEKNSKYDMFTNHLSSVKTPATSSTLPMHEIESEEIRSKEQASAANGGSSLLPLALTPLQTAATETEIPALAEDSWEVPMLPKSPRLRRLTSPGLPLVSPIMGRRGQVLSVSAENQNWRPNSEVDKEDKKTDSQGLTGFIIEDPSQDGNASGVSPESHRSLGLDDDYFGSPSRHVQVTEGMAQAPPTFSPDGPVFAQQLGRDNNNISMEYWNSVRAARGVSVGYSRSSRQTMSSDSASSVPSGPEGEVGSQRVWSAEDFEGFTTDDVSSEDLPDGAQGEELQELLEEDSSDEEQSWNDEDDDKDTDPLAHDQADDERDANKEKTDTVRAQGDEVIDLENDSENASQQGEASPSVHTLDEVFLDLAAVKSPLQDRSQSMVVDLDSSTSEIMDESEIPESISYPILPGGNIEQSRASHSPLVPDSENAWEGRLDPRLRTQLITPSATQQMFAGSEVSIEPLYQDHDLPTPQLTQSTTAGLLPLEVTPSLEQRASLLYKLKEMRTSLASKTDGRTSDVTDVISPWFAPKRPSQVQQESEDDDKSGGESEHSLELGAEDPINQVKRQPNRSVSYVPPPGLPDSSFPHNGHAITPEPRPAPPAVGLRTRLSYFAPLATVPDNFASTVDVLAIATSTTPIQRSKSGPKDYHMTLHITDPSSNLSTTRVQIFRPFKDALPMPEKGAAILLRNFKVQSQKHRLILVSTASSAWAVFGKGQSVQVNGPPVEMAAEERGFAKGLREWWASISEDVKAANDREERWRGRLKKRDDDDINGDGITKRSHNGTNELRDATV